MPPAQNPGAARAVPSPVACSAISRVTPVRHPFASPPPLCVTPLRHPVVCLSPWLYFIPRPRRPRLARAPRGRLYYSSRPCPQALRRRSAPSAALAAARARARAQAPALLRRQIANLTPARLRGPPPARPQSVATLSRRMLPARAAVTPPLLGACPAPHAGAKPAPGPPWPPACPAATPAGRWSRTRLRRGPSAAAAGPRRAVPRAGRCARAASRALGEMHNPTRAANRARARAQPARPGRRRRPTPRSTKAPPRQPAPAPWGHRPLGRCAWHATPHMRAPVRAQYPVSQFQFRLSRPQGCAPFRGAACTVYAQRGLHSRGAACTVDHGRRPRWQTQPCARAAAGGRRPGPRRGRRPAGPTNLKPRRGRSRRRAWPPAATTQHSHRKAAHLRRLPRPWPRLVVGAPLDKGLAVRKGTATLAGSARARARAPPGVDQ